MNKVFNFGWGTLTVQWDDAKESGLTPSKLMCYDAIGKDPWTGGGITADDFSKALNELPKDRDVHLHVNSKGGDVHQGMAMGNNLLAWKNETGKKVITVIDGIAASTASWAFLAASDEVRAFKSSQIFVHDAFAYVGGNEEELIKVAADLGKTSDQIAGMYSDRAGGSKKSWRDKMRDETLMTGEEAEESGLVDSIVNGKAVRNFTPREIGSMHNRLSAISNSIAKRDGEQKQNGTDKMKQKIINMLAGLGVTTWEGKPINDATTDEHIEAALASVTNKKAEDKSKLEQKDSSAATLAQINELKAQIAGLTEANGAARTLRITTAVTNLKNDDQLTEKEYPAALKRALADETYLDELRARPSAPPGGSPLKPLAEVKGNSFNEIQGYILENGPKFTNQFIQARADGHLGAHTLEAIRDRAIVVANTIAKNKAMLVEMFNTNTIDPGL